MKTRRACKALGHRALAMLLCLCSVVSLFSSFGGAVSYAAEPVQATAAASEPARTQAAEAPAARSAGPGSTSRAATLSPQERVADPEGWKDQEAWKSEARVYLYWTQGSTGGDDFLGVKKRNYIHVYAKAGETIALGTNVWNSTLNKAGTAATDNKDPDYQKSDIVMTRPDGTEMVIDIEQNGPGHIQNADMDMRIQTEMYKLRAQADGTYTGVLWKNEDGGKEEEYSSYKPYTIKVLEDGVYTFAFHSPSGKDTPTQHNKNGEFLSTTGNLVSAWDASVYGEDLLRIPGRTYADYLALQEVGKVNEDYYIVTSDSYIYKMDFLGATPNTYNFFANNRGFVDSATGNIVYKSIKVLNNLNLKTGPIKDLGVQFQYPGIKDSDLAKSYYIFFEKPNEDLEGVLYKRSIAPDAPTNIRFTTEVTDAGVTKPGTYVGMGGYFAFDVQEATTASLRLEFHISVEKLMEGFATTGGLATEYEAEKFESWYTQAVKAGEKLFETPITDFTSNGLKTYVTEHGDKEINFAPVEISDVVTPYSTNKFYWNGKDGSGVVIPQGVYSLDDILYTVTAKAGEIHFPIFDVESASAGFQITRVSDLYDRSGVLLDDASDAAKNIYGKTRQVIYYDDSNIYYGDGIAATGNPERESWVSTHTVTIEKITVTYGFSLSDFAKENPPALETFTTNKTALTSLAVDFQNAIKTQFNNDKSNYNKSVDTTNDLYIYGNLKKNQGEYNFYKNYAQKVDSSIRVGDHSHNTFVINYFDAGGIIENPDPQQEAMIQALSDPVGVCTGSNVTDYGVANYWTFTPSQKGTPGTAETLTILDGEMFNISGRVFYDEKKDGLYTPQDDGDTLLGGIGLNLYKQVESTDVYDETAHYYVKNGDTVTEQTIDESQFNSMKSDGNLFRFIASSQTTLYGEYAFTNLPYPKGDDTDTYLYEVVKPDPAYELTSGIRGTATPTNVGYYNLHQFVNGSGTERQQFTVGVSSTGGAVDPYKRDASGEIIDRTLAVIDVGYHYETFDPLTLTKNWDLSTEGDTGSTVVLELSYVYKDGAGNPQTKVYQLVDLAQILTLSKTLEYLPKYHVEQGETEGKPIEAYYVSAEYYVNGKCAYKHTYDFVPSGTRYRSSVGTTYIFDLNQYVKEHSDLGEPLDNYTVTTLPDLDGDKVSSFADLAKINDLEGGSAWQKDTTAAAPYKSSIDMNNAPGGSTITVTNTDQKGTIEIVKYTGEARDPDFLSGAVFRVYEGYAADIKALFDQYRGSDPSAAAEAWTKLSAAQVGGNYITRAGSGIATITGLDQNKVYTVQEYMAPGGYQLDQEFYQVIPSGKDKDPGYKDWQDENGGPLVYEFGKDSYLDKNFGEYDDDPTTCRFPVVNREASDELEIRKQILGRGWLGDTASSSGYKDEYTFQLSFDYTEGGDTAKAFTLAEGENLVNSGYETKVREFLAGINKQDPIKIDYKSEFYTGSDGEDDSKTSGKIVVKAAKDGGDWKSATLRGVEFPAAGRYSFTISEIVPAPGLKDSTIDYSTLVYDVVVNVTRVADEEELSGELTTSNSHLESSISSINYRETAEDAASYKYGEKDPLFTNEYKVAPAEQETKFAIQKILEGRDWLGGRAGDPVQDQFDFTVTPNAATLEAIKDGDLTIGAFYDQIAALRADEGSSDSFKASVTYASGTDTGTDGLEYLFPLETLEFRDIHFPTKLVYKDEDGNEITEEKYEEKKAAGEAVSTEEVEEPVVYELSIAEVTPADATEYVKDGVTYDRSVYTLRITLENVAKDGSAEEEEDDGLIDKMTFDVYLTKDRDGTQVTEDYDETAHPEVTGVEYDPALGRLISRCYTVQEKIEQAEYEKYLSNPEAYTYSGVGYDEELGLYYAKTETHAKSDGTHHNIPFTNVYAPGPATWAPAVTKVLTGREWKEKDAFEFTLDCTSVTPGGAFTLPKPTTITITSADQAADYTKSFGAITFSKPGVYTVTITETLPDGITVDGMEAGSITYNVTVVDNNKGDLVISSYTQGTGVPSATRPNVEFHNVYADTAKTFDLTFLKTLVGRDVLVNEKFTFYLMPDTATASAIEADEIKITDLNGLPFDPETEEPHKGAYKFTIKADEDHEFDGPQLTEAVGQISFVKGVEAGTGGYGKQYKFTVTEQKPDGMTPSPQQMDLTVNVTRKVNKAGIPTGELDVVATYVTDSSGEAITAVAGSNIVLPFTNTLVSEVTVSKTVAADDADKAVAYLNAALAKVKGKDVTADDLLFKFTVTGTLSGAPLTGEYAVSVTDKDSKPVEDTTRFPDGKLSFGESGKATFDLHDGETLHIQNLPIGTELTVHEDGLDMSSLGFTEENKPDDPFLPVQNDQQVKVELGEDNAAVGGTAKFENRYAPIVIDQPPFNLRKVLVGREFEHDDEFVFHIQMNDSTRALYPTLESGKEVYVHVDCDYTDDFHKAIDGEGEEKDENGNDTYTHHLYEPLKADGSVDKFGDPAPTELKTNPTLFPVRITKAGVYIYTIHEETTDRAAALKDIKQMAGVTYSNEEYQVRITVTEEKGQLKRKIDWRKGTYLGEGSKDQWETNWETLIDETDAETGNDTHDAPATLAFTNTYSANEINYHFTATKHLDYQALEADQFHFQLTAVGWRIPETLKIGDQGYGTEYSEFYDKTLGNLNTEQAEELEKLFDSQLPSELSDDMKAFPGVTNINDLFSTEFKPTQPMPDGSTNVDGKQVKTAQNGGEGKEAYEVDFGSVTFTHDNAGDTDIGREWGVDYLYKIEETDKDGSYDYDDFGPRYVVIRISTTDGDTTGSGAAGAAAEEIIQRQIVYRNTASTDGVPRFINSYKAEGSVPIQMEKDLVGRPFQEGDTFTFTMTGAVANGDGEAPMPAAPEGVSPDENGAWTADGESVQKDASGKLTYSRTVSWADPAAAGDTVDNTPDESGKVSWKFILANIPFTAADIGKTFNYEIKETKGSLPGVTYDTNTWNVGITVHEKDPADPGSSKDGELYFTISYLGGSMGTAAPAVFTNTYAPEQVELDPKSSDINKSFHGIKTITGRDWKKDDSFSFRLAAMNPADAPMPVDEYDTVDDTVETDPADGTHAFTFGTITYTKAGTYIYRITEIPGSEQGMAYADPVYVAVTIVDNTKTGKLEVKSVGYYTGYDEASGSCTGEQKDQAAFTNVYTPPAGDLRIEKTVAGEEHPDRDSFQVTVTLDVSELPAGVTLDKGGYTAVYGGSGASGASPIKFAQVEGDKTKYTATVTLKHGQSVTIQGLPQGVKYTVEETADSATGYGVSYYPAASGAVSADESRVLIVNAKGAATPTLNVRKRLNTNGFLEEGQKYTFTFTLEPTGSVTGDPVADLPGKVQTGTVAVSSAEAVGNFWTDETNILDGLKFEKEGVYQYTLQEEKKVAFDSSYSDVHQENFTFDETVYNVTVTVKSASAPGGAVENYTAVVAVQGPGGETVPEATFVNTYGYGQQELALQGRKEIEGREWNEKLDGGAYSFTLTPVDTLSADNKTVLTHAADTPMPEDQVYTVTNGADGGIHFGRIVYTRPGTYTYQVTESSVDPVLLAKGVTADSRTYQLTVKVGIELSGNKIVLSAPEVTAAVIVGAPTYDGGAAGEHFVFVNQYQPTPVELVLRLRKTVTGRAAGSLWDDGTDAGAYQFQVTRLMEESDDPLCRPDTVAALSNAGKTAGWVSFPSITYTAAGTYYYAIREIGSAVPTVPVRDDLTVYAKVVVTDDGEGTLTATASYYKTYAPGLGGTPALSGEITVSAGGTTRYAPFENVYHHPTHSLTVSKTVFSDVPDDEAAFRFTVTLMPGEEGLVGQKLSEDDSAYTFEPGDVEHEYKYNADDGSATVTFALKNGEKLTIGNLPEGTKYVVEEEATDYAMSASDDKDTLTRDKEAAFTNYKGAARPSRTISKLLNTNGYDPGQRTFTFILEPAAGNPAGDPVQAYMDSHPGGHFTKQLTVSADNHWYATGNLFTGGEDNEQLVFAHPGTYVYTLREYIPTSGAPDGFTYDKTTYTVKVVVKDQDEIAPAAVMNTGNLVVESIDITRHRAGEEDVSGLTSAAFENVYDLTHASVTIEGLKAMEGRAWDETVDDGAYTFTLTADGADTPMPGGTSERTVVVTNGADLDGDGAIDAGAGQTVHFGAIDYAKPGTYTYTITEGASSVPHVAADESAVYVRVTVEQDGGALNAEAVYARDSGFTDLFDPADEALFTNKYTHPTGSLTVSKRVSGEDAETDRDFRFTVTLTPGAGDETAHALSEDKGAYTFTGTGSFEKYDYDPVNGTVVVTFTLSHGESLTIGGLPEGTRYSVTEESVDQDGYTTSATGRSGTVSEAGVTAAFTNSKGLAVPELNVTKVLDVGTYYVPAGTEFPFTFALTPDAGNPDNDPVKTAKGYDADNGYYPVTISVSEADHYTAFANIFAGIGFGIEGTAKTAEYRYTLRELSEPAIPGVTYDESVYDVVVQVHLVQGTTGIYGATVTAALHGGGSSGGAAGVTFTNTYSLESVTAAFQGVKTITGRAWDETQDSGAYQFVLRAVDTLDGTGEVLTSAGDTPMPGGLGGSAAVTNVGQTILFDEITYTRPGTYTYEIEELSAATPNVGRSDRTITVTVTVDMDAAEKLTEPVVTYAWTDAEGADHSDFAFANEYVHPTGSLTVSKRVSGEDAETDRDFAFTVTLTPGAGDKTAHALSEDGSEYTFTGSFEKYDYDPANGTVVVTFTLSHGESLTIGGLPEGTRYSVTEESVDQDGYTTSATGRSGTVSEAGVTAAFTNSKGLAVPELNVTKVLDVGTYYVPAGTEFPFRFALTPDAGNPDNDPVKTAKGYDADNGYYPVTISVSEADHYTAFTNIFAGIGFGIEGAGKTAEYRYTLRELREPAIPGVTYDESVYDVVVQVHLVQGTTGIYGATVTAALHGGGSSGGATGVTFTNTYSLESVTAAFQGVKTITGRAWDETQDSGAYQFVLRAVDTLDGTGEVLTSAGDTPMPGGLGGSAAVTNVGQTILFDEITYTRPGTYTYEIEELSAATPNVGKSDRTIAVTVTVDMDAAEKLTEPVVTYAWTDAEGADHSDFAFANEYVHPTGSLTVSKRVSGEDAEIDRDFAFTVTLTPGAGDETAHALSADKDAYTFTGTGSFEKYDYDPANGTVVVTFTLSHGESLTIGGLPEGTRYSVTEESVDQDGYTTSATGRSGTVSEAGVTAAFTNSKGLAVPELNVTKVLDVGSYYVPAGTEFPFTFALTPDAGNPDNDPVKTAKGYDADNGYYPVTVTVGEAGHYTAFANIFAGIGFGIEGAAKTATYRYTLRELREPAIPGVTYDESVYDVVIQVHLVQGTTGIYGATVTAALQGGGSSGGDAGVTFTNTYSLESVTAAFQGVKTITGRAWDETQDSGAYQFVLRAVDTLDGAGEVLTSAGDTPMPGGLGGSAAVTNGADVDGDGTVSSEESGIILFDTITYTRPGTYTYEIEELSAATPNVGRSDRTITVTVTVEMDAAQKLTEPVVTYAWTDAEGADHSDFAFANEYTHPTGSLTVSKQVTGGQGDTDTPFGFTVTLTPGAGDETAHALSEDKGAYTFAPEQAEMTYTYGQDGSVTIWFALSHGESLTIGGLPEGTKYTVSEDAANQDHYTTSPASGQYDGVIRAGGNTAAFTNSRGLAMPELNVTKVLHVHSYVPADTQFHFRFSLTPDADNPADDPVTAAPYDNGLGYSDADGCYYWMLTVGEDANYTAAGNIFDELYFGVPDNGTEAVYRYTLREVDEDKIGVTYDPAEYDVTVTVSLTQGTTGIYTATATVEKRSAGGKSGAEIANAAGVTFENAYDLDPATAVIEGTKAVDGHDWTADYDGAFQFILTASDAGTPMPGGGYGGSVAAVNAGQTIRFDAIGYAEPGTYDYTLTELAVDGTKAPNVARSDEIVYVRVTVAPAGGTSSLAAAVAYSTDPDFAAGTVFDPADRPLFTNTYISPVGGLSVTKRVTGADGDQTKPFSFTVTLTPGAGDAAAHALSADGSAYTFGPEGTYTSETAQDGAVISAAVTFSLRHGQTFTIEGLPEGTVYAVAEDETAAAADGYATSYRGASGTIAAGQTAAVQVTNNRGLARPALTAVKQLLTNGYDLGDQTFTFELRPVAGNPTDDPITAPVTRSVTVSSAAPTAVSGDFFEGAAFPSADAVYDYTLRELGPDDGITATPGMGYDGGQYAVEVHIFQVGGDEGTYSADVIVTKDGAPAEEALFTNTYDPGGVLWTLNGWKVLHSADSQLAEGQFTFELRGVGADTPKPEGALDEAGGLTWVATAVNRADGGFTFGSIQFTKAGQYGYILRERMPAHGSPDMDRMIYDEDVYEISVQVEDVNGALAVTSAVYRPWDSSAEAQPLPDAAGPDAGVVFTNFMPAKTGSDESGNALSGQTVQVGQPIVYTIDWMNTSDTAAADVVITDSLDGGIDLVSASYTAVYTDAGGTVVQTPVTLSLSDGSQVTGPDQGTITYSASNRVVTWTLPDRPAGASGVVTLTVQVNASAVKQVENDAEVKVGNQSAVTNTEQTPVDSADLTVTKTLAYADDAERLDSDRFVEFIFDVDLAQDGLPVTGSYSYTLTSDLETSSGTLAVTGGAAQFQLRAGQSIVIHGLPEGTSYAITERPVSGYVSTAPDNASGDNAAGAVVEFVNTKQGPKAAMLSLSAHKLYLSDIPMQGGEFSFAVEPMSKIDGDPIQERTLVVNEANGLVNLFNHVPYNRAGTYRYLVSEATDSVMPGVLYDTKSYIVAVTVTPNTATGKMELSVSAAGAEQTLTKTEMPDGDAYMGDLDPVQFGFVNEYRPGTVSVVLGGEKELVGRELTDEAFTFQISDMNGTYADEPVTTTELDGAEPVAPVSEATTPETTTPEAMTPETTTPEATTPEATTPEATTPEATVPEATTPEATTPEATTPEATTPEVTEPEMTESAGEPTEPAAPANISLADSAALTAPIAAVPDVSTPDGGTPDVSAPDMGMPDAGTPDAGTPDAGTPDAGTPDSGTPDAGTPDVSTPDAGMPDVGTPDAGTPDAGTPDAGTPDAGTPDAGTPDVSTPDVGTPDAGTPNAGTPDAGTPEAGGQGMASPAAPAANEAADGDLMTVANDIPDTAFPMPGGKMSSEVGGVCYTSNVGGRFRFDPIVFTEPGTYYYGISEVPDPAGEPGTVYDLTQYFARVDVVDAGDGVLTAAVTYLRDGVESGTVTDSARFVNRVVAKTEIDPGEGRVVQAGRQVTYEVAWTNFVADGANVVVEDLLDPGVGYVSAGVPGAEDGSYSVAYDEAARTVTWDLGPKMYGESGTVQLTVSVNADAVNAWAYDETVDYLAGAPGDGEDEKIVNRAMITVTPDPALAAAFGPASVLTNIVMNPVTVRMDEQLRVTKIVSGSDGDVNQPFNFTVTLTDDTINGTYGTMEFVDGQAVFTLRHGESRMASGLPNGVGYAVAETEANADGYVTTSTGDRGTIVDGVSASAVFVNAKNATPPPAQETGGLIVFKMVTGTDAQTGKAFTFTVELSDKVNGLYSGVAFVDGKATFTLKHMEFMMISGLPAGCGYTVTESGADDYRATPVNPTGVIPANGDAGVVFINEKIDPSVTPEPTATQTPTATPEPTATPVPDVTPGPDGGPVKAVINPGEGKPVTVGQQVTYEIAWSNYKLTEAAVMISDPLDGGVAFVNASGGEYDAASHTVTWDLGKQPAGAHGIVTVTVTVTETALKEGVVRNQAIVTVGGDPSQSSNTTETTVSAPKTSYVGDTPKTGDEASPGLWLAMLALCGAGLLGLGTAARRRKRGTGR